MIARDWRLSSPRSECAEKSIKAPVEGKSRSLIHPKHRYLFLDARFQLAQPEESSAACSSTVCVAFSCLSGGYSYFRRILFTRNRNCARTFSRIVQSMMTRPPSSSNDFASHFCVAAVYVRLDLGFFCFHFRWSFSVAQCDQVAARGQTLMHPLVGRCGYKTRTVDQAPTIGAATVSALTHRILLGKHPACRRHSSANVPTWPTMYRK